MEDNKRPSQAVKILRYMKDFGTITQYEALRDIGCMRLASRISELRYQGYPIVTNMVDVKNRDGKTISIAQYSLKED